MATSTRVTELQGALRDRLAIMDGIATEFKIDGANVEVTSDQAANYRKALADAEEIKSLIVGEESRADMHQWASGAREPSVAQAVAAGVQDAMTGMSHKTLGELVTESEEFKAMRASGTARMDRAYQVETSDMASMVGGRKDVYTASAPVQTTLGFGRTQFDPMVPRAMRTQRVRDLFPAAQTDANLIDFFRVIGFGSTRLDQTSGAAPVRERAAADGVAAGNVVFGLKPKSNLTFQSAQAPVRTIAHYEIAHRNVLADEPQLQSTINNELLYGLRLEEDDQILNGDGTGENLLGLLATPGLQTYAQTGTPATPTETKADALRRASTKAALAYYVPTGYVLHPYDWEDIELTKETTGAYVITSNVAVGAQTQLWRQPVIESPVIPQLTFVTGAWGMGAQIYDRMQSNIRIADQHSDFFIRNAVAILAESRLAFAVKRPESFVKGTFLADA